MKNKRKCIRDAIKKNWFWITIGLLVGALSFMVISGWNTDEDYMPRACGGDRCFMVELARTSAEHQQGLMHRESMEDNDGMLFIFDQSAVHRFRMKNTLIPLDMVRIDEELKVLSIITAQPCTTDPCPSFTPNVPVKYVLEINAGMAQKHEITEGTKMKLINIQ